MALIFIFLSYRYPCLSTCFLCLSLILMRHYNSDIEYQLELKEFLRKQINIYSIFFICNFFLIPIIINVEILLLR